MIEHDTRLKLFAAQPFPTNADYTYAVHSV